MSSLVGLFLCMCDYRGVCESIVFHCRINFLSFLFCASRFSRLIVRLTWRDELTRVFIFCDGIVLLCLVLSAFSMMLPCKCLTLCSDIAPIKNSGVPYLKNFEEFHNRLFRNSNGRIREVRQRFAIFKIIKNAYDI